MNQQYPQFDSKIIETLKAARNQVVQDESPERSRGTDKSGSLEISRPKVAAVTPKEGGSLTGFAPLEARAKSTANTSGVLPLTGFAEEFVQKLTFIEKEIAEIDEEMAKLKVRRGELIKVKDKLAALDKEMTDFLSKRSEL